MGGFVILVVELLVFNVDGVWVEENDVLSVDLLELAFVMSLVTFVDIDGGVNVVVVEALVFSVVCGVEIIEILVIVLVFVVEAVSVDLVNGFSEVLVRVGELTSLVLVLAVVSSVDARVGDVCFVEISVVTVDGWVPDADILLLLDVGWYVLVIPVVELISFVEGVFAVAVKVDDDALVEVLLLVEFAVPEGVLKWSLVEVEASFDSVEVIYVPGVEVVWFLVIFFSEVGLLDVKVCFSVVDAFVVVESCVGVVWLSIVVLVALPDIDVGVLVLTVVVVGLLDSFFELVLEIDVVSLVAIVAVVDVSLIVGGIVDWVDETAGEEETNVVSFVVFLLSVDVEDSLVCSGVLV